MEETDLDVARILQELKQAVRERYRGSEIDVPLERLASLAEVHARSWIDPYRPIAWPHWPKGVWPKLVAVAQKATRRLLAWYITPIVEDQNRYNAAVADALTALSRENAQLRAKLWELTSTQENEELSQHEG
ncbi:MAG: hypothetical protein JW963_24060 [Anaerolineales bacterium]|nr:hypothetical protein [Anaerolineales bacterium]